MKLTVIGHWGAYPEANEATSCYLVEHNGFKLVVDCGSGALSQLQNHCQLHEIDAVLLSHYHHDHIADIGPLQYSWLIAHSLKSTEKILPIYGHRFDQVEFEKLFKPPHVVSHMYDEQSQLQVGPFKVSFFETDHKATCFAIRLEVDGKVIVYTADSSYMANFHQFAKEADLFICETSFYAHQDGKPYGHMNSIEAGTIANDASVKKLILTHLPHFGDHQQLITEAKTAFTGDVFLAQKGLTIEL